MQPLRLALELHDAYVPAATQHPTTRSIAVAHVRIPASQLVYYAQAPICLSAFLYQQRTCQMHVLAQNT